MYALEQPMVLGPDSTTYVPEKQFWITALLDWYSSVSHVFSWAALFSNICQYYDRK